MEIRSWTECTSSDLFQHVTRNQPFRTEYFQSNIQPLVFSNRFSTEFYEKFVNHAHIIHFVRQQKANEHSTKLTQIWQVFGRMWSSFRSRTRINFHNLVSVPFKSWLIVFFEVPWLIVECARRGEKRTGHGLSFLPVAFLSIACLRIIVF